MCRSKRVVAGMASTLFIFHATIALYWDMSDEKTIPQATELDKSKVQQMVQQVRFGRLFMCWGMSQQAFGIREVSFHNTREEDQEEARKCDVYIRFKVNGLKFKGFVYVLLDYSDTYRVLLVKSSMRRPKGQITPVIKNKVVFEAENIYCDQLAKFIDDLVETEGFEPAK